VERYQTVYARHEGSIAAPTAGLHFTERVFDDLRNAGVGVCEILLHVGYGTFQPVRTENLEEHRMEAEFFEVSPAAAEAIFKRKWSGKRLIAVGTSTTRALEFLARQQPFPLRGASGWCDLFIYPGFKFRLLDGLLTNFHLPGSTLLMLVCAFAGTDFTRECYRQAIRERYRFYSYGDCMLIL
jgi:S-adenosylmethionine:tRNA ribosyltransferase-isomerase